MSFSNISDILVELNRDGSNQKSALALSQTSEAEIKNMLKQIDTMINHKKLKWERQKQELDIKMEAKEQENLIQKAQLEQKNNEIGKLKKLIDNMDSRTHDIMKKYETEIEKLTEQLEKTKSDYFKMQRKIKRNKGSGGSGGGGSNNNQRRSERIGGGQQISGLNSLNSSLSEAVCFNDKNEMKQKYENEIANLKSQLNEHKLKEMELYHEKENLQKQLENYKEANLDLHRRVNELNKSQNLTKNLSDKAAFYESEIRKKDEQIRNLETSIKQTAIINPKTAETSDLKTCREEVKKYKNKETTVRHELNKLKVEYNEAMKRLNNLENESRKMKPKSGVPNEDRNKNNEIIGLKKKINAEKEQHLQEVQVLKNEIYTFSNQITEKNNHIRNLNEKINVLERVIKEKDEILERTSQESHMTMAHIEALRLENHFLRQSATEKKSDDKNVVEMQKKYHEVIELTEKENKRLKNEVISLTQMVEDLRKSIHNESNPAYRHSSENADLNYRRLKVLKDDYDKQIEQLKQHHDLSVKRLNSEIEKLNGEKFSLLSELDAAKINGNFTHQQTNNNTTGVSNNHFLNPNNRPNISSSIIAGGDYHTSTLSSGTLRSGISSNSRNDFNYKTSRSNNIEYTEDVPSRSEAFQNQERDIFKYQKKSNQLENNENSPSTQIRLSFGTQFRLDENKRKKELENLLDSHIEALRKSTGPADNILGHHNANVTNYVR